MVKKLINLLKWPVSLYFAKPDTPAPPDYRAAAVEQGANNIATARLQNQMSNPNVITPYGSRNITYNGDQPTITEFLSPAEQNLYDQNTAIKGGLLDVSQGGLNRVGTAFNQPFDMASAPQMTSYGDLDNTNQVAESLQNRYQPQMDERRQRALDNLLIQGHSRGGDAYNTTTRDFNQAENDFALASLVQAGNERRADNTAQMQGEAADRDRFLAEQSFTRNVPLNEVNALRTGNQVTPYNYQGFSGANIQSAPIFDATLGGAAADQNIYGQQVAQRGDLFSGIGQLAGAGATAYAGRKGLGSV